MIPQKLLHVKVFIAYHTSHIKNKAAVFRRLSYYWRRRWDLIRLAGWRKMLRAFALLAFFDRCGTEACPFSAAGSGQASDPPCGSRKMLRTFALLAFFDHCGTEAFPSSATGSGQASVPRRFMQVCSLCMGASSALSQFLTFPRRSAGRYGWSHPPGPCGR